MGGVITGKLSYFQFHGKCLGTLNNQLAMYIMDFLFRRSLYYEKHPRKEHKD